MAATPAWSELSPLLDELLELEGDARAQRLAEIAAGQPDLASELRRLLALDESRPDFLAEPVIDATVFSAQAGQEIGPYRLIMPLGEGGMGQVWLAMRADGLYERRVALKLLRPGLGGAGLRARFTRERQILARLGHAHIARLLDAGVSADGQPYLALDYIRGDPITAYARTQSLDVPTRLALFAQVCAAVSHAHANLVVHRDLKPSNILVTPAGEVCLLDFGIAKLLDQDTSLDPEITQTGARAFTLHYAAPEQLRGEPVSTMTDVYALGMVLYELLTERKPYELSRQSDAAWEEAILREEPVRPSQAAMRLARETKQAADRRRAKTLAGDLDNIVLKALNKLPEERYPSVEALAQDLRRYRDGQPVHARAHSLGYRARKYVSRHALGLGVAAAISAVLLSALGVVSWQAQRALREAARAQAMQDFVVALFENTDSATARQGLDVRALLDAGVRRADTELGNQPQARAELIGLIARLRVGLGDYREALTLLDREQELLRILGSDAPGNLRLDAAALRGRSLRELGRADECIRDLAPLMPLADNSVGNAPLETAEFFSQLGRCHRQLHGAQVARDLFGQALQLRRGLPDGKALEAESQTDLAMIALDAGQAETAVRALHDALDRLRNAGGERNALGVQIWSALGEGYRRQNNLIEAEAAYRQALDISLSRFSSSHPDTLAVQRQLADVLADTGKLDEAGRLLELARDGLLAQAGADSLPVAQVDSQLGQVALAQRQAGVAEAYFSHALHVWRAQGVLDVHGRDLCRLSEARAALNRADADAVGDDCLGALRRARSGELEAAIASLAQAALDRADTAGAERWLRQLPVNTVSPAVALVRVRLHSLSAAPADALLQAVINRAGPDPQYRRWRWQAQALRASLACRDGRAKEGESLRNQAVTEIRRDEPDNKSLLQRLLTDSADCAPIPPITAIAPSVASASGR